MDLARKLIVVAGLGLTLWGCASGNSSVAPLPPTRVNLSTLPQAASAAAMGDDAYTTATLTAINADRGTHGVPPLTPNNELQHAAAVHSADMSIRHFVGDFNPDEQGPTERVKAVWPEFKGDLVENISVNSGVLADKSATTPEALAAAVLKRWQMTPDQRKNMRGSAYTLGGIGIARAGDQIFVTGLFATP